MEIKEWLDRHEDVQEWIAIDDDNLLKEIGGDFVRGHFVKTEFSSALKSKREEEMAVMGLKGDEKTEEAIRLLTR